jgi:MFS family permease
VIVGFALTGSSSATSLLVRTAAGDMYPPLRRARGISYVLFGSVFGAILGPTVFSPLFAGKNLTADKDTGTGRFTDQQIFNALRYGLRPEDTPDVKITSRTPGQGNFPKEPKYLGPFMPWASWRYMSDEDLWSIIAYLRQGLRPVSNKVELSDDAPDHWASAVAELGAYPAPAFPTANEVKK